MIIKTTKIKNPGTEHWIEYTEAIQQPNGSWKSSALGKFKLIERNMIIETLTKSAYGKTACDAEDGARKRALTLIMHVMKSVKSCYENEE